ncbi:TorD/DmsD family molecular chaperone [Litchfieldella anticariensis]|nr:molecular chaperone TorD family protein [Halomonas anticariensis]
MSEITTLPNDAELEETQALRAEIYRLLSRLLREAPDQPLLDWLSALEVENDGSALTSCWSSLAIAAREASSDALTRAHFRHLVGVIEGDVIPYASWYRNGDLMDEALITLRRDIKQLGFERSEDTQDPEDHLAAICEVMAMLIEAHSSAEATFFMKHLAPWASRCFADLEAVDTLFYSRLGRLGRTFIDMEFGRLEDEANHETVRLVEP